ncbi:chondroitinase family polysaccharide lyase [Avibacterium paragallinarum]|uniref:Chondroitin sulfate ABC lyase n=1 Tax=Avibacterium paragallinarum TaxID=728 RepID=A0A377IA22_AVIPA|nr:chondroitinase family polysaccharide lyase [Avibacterium paragallinarum]KAA6208799.1 chondroitinase [Avibacterium paragallinarum]RZN56579.1 chondroitinase [Avibacterium paragallinarum]RZN70760.1 chondroitinase [Avibacterium paragallinarum]RZN74705.1 chondroitinase [Avibacterium paragallinarum]STO72011.1 Chondroitin sulfate ABC endolyase precursor [Avibacterium paragallinarum]
MKVTLLSRLTFLTASLMMGTASANYYVWDFFEGEKLPDSMTINGGQVAPSQLRYKDGRQSLRWQFQPKSELVFNQQIDLSKDDAILPQTFMLWLYNDKPFKQPLQFDFEQQGKVKKSFKINLDFTGWRGIAVPFRDMPGGKVLSLDKLVIKAPNEAGTLYLDQLLFNVPVDNRYPIPDYQADFVNPTASTAVNKNWNALLMNDQRLSQIYPHLDFNAKLHSDPKIESIYQRFEQVLNISETKKSAVDFSAILKKYQAFNISEKDGVIQGAILDFPARQKFMKNDQVFSKQEQAFLLNSISMRELGKVMLESAKVLRMGELTPEQRQQLENQFLLATRYLFDQGFVRGSSIQIVSHMGYQNREIFDAWFLMRDLLSQQGLLEQAQGAMAWFSGAGRIFEPDSSIVEANVDILNTQLQWMLKSILLLPNENQRAGLLKQFSHWLSTTVLQSQGVAGGFKPDGSMFHHSQHYTAYGKDAFTGLSPVVYAISGTPYALTQEAKKRLDDVLYKMWVYTKNGNIPIVISGRHPTGKFSIASSPFKWFALVGDEKTGEKINRTFASIYAALEHKEEFEGVPAAAEPTGAWTMNYASMVVQRRHQDDPKHSWLAIARGFSRYLVGNESYEKNNLYGRYMSYGALEIIPTHFNDRGYRYDGWDWNRFPGTTTIHLPYAELRAKLAQLPSAGLEEMLLSTETYAGGTDLHNNSMYAMKLRGHSKYQQESLFAQKSYFLFDNQIIALGTDVQNTDSQHKTETTLFQHNVDDLKPIFVNGKSIATLGSVQEMQSPVTLADPAGNRYYVPEGQTLTLYYQNQESVDERNDKPTKGKFATAVLEHGKAPKDGKYEYAVLITPKSEESVAYQKLSHNSKLHAIRDNRSGQEGYAYFDALQKDVGGIILGADKPLMAMAQQGKNTLDLSIVNPDLAFYQGTEEDQVKDGKQVEVSIYSRSWRKSPSQPQYSTVTVKGKWKLENASQCANIELKGKATMVSTHTTDATPCKVHLVAVK